MNDSGSDLRTRLDAVLRPFMLVGSAGAGAPMTERRVAATARDAATAVVAVLEKPPRSAQRVRKLIMPVLVCGWAEFDAAYAAMLDALMALPPATPGIEDPAWDAELAPEPQARRKWLDDGRWRTPPAYASETTAPGGTVGRIVHRGTKTIVISEDGRSIRVHSQCQCETAERRSRTEVAYEVVHLRRNGSVLDVVIGAACAGCRAPIT